MSKKLPLISVIVPVYNDARALRRCLHSLKSQSYPNVRFEVIVIDNGSDNDNPKAVVKEFPGFRFSVETKAGSYAARNKGLSLAAGDALAFIDSDCIASPDWIQEGMQTLLAHPECGFVGGFVELFAKDPLNPTSVELQQRITALQFQDWVELRVCATCNMFTWAKVFHKAGLFNESLKSGGDFEWSSRVVNAGLNPIYNKSMIVRHPARRTWRQVIKRQRRIAGGRIFHRNWRQNKVAYPKSSLHRILNAIIPNISYMRKVCFDHRLNKKSEQIRVGLVTLVMHYVWLMEVSRLILGGKSTRS